MKPMQLLDLALLATRQIFSGPAMPETPAAEAPPARPIRLPDGNFTMEDKAAFYRYVRNNITGPLSQIQVDTIERILVGATRWDVGELAYGLATAWHEALLKPIPEWGKGRGRKYGRPGKWYGQIPYGRGLVQLTWDFNYEWADAALGLGGKLLRNFDLALDPDIAARILVLGMETGAFTGKGLGNYLPATGRASFEEFVRARRIINGTDKAAKIAEHAIKFQHAAILGQWKD